MSDRDQQAAIAAIESVGGVVLYEEAHESTPIPRSNRKRKLATTRQFLPRRVILAYLDKPIAAVIQQLETLSSVQFLYLPDSGLTDEDLRCVGRMSGLVELNIADTQITDAGLAHLLGLKGLRFLSVYNTPLSDAGLRHIRCLTALEGLNLGSTNITDLGLEHLATLPNLQALDLCGTQITDGGVARLAAVQTLRQIYLHETCVTEVGAHALNLALPRCQIIRESPWRYWAARAGRDHGGCART